MDLLTLLETCSVADDLTLVLAMALTFSAGDPNTVRESQSMIDVPVEVAELEPPALDRSPHSRDEALETLHRYVQQGTPVVAGILPVPPEWAVTIERPVDDLLDPCAGLAIATAAVSQFEYECGPRPTRTCVLAKYAQAASLEFFDQDVLQSLKLHKLGTERARVVIETPAIVDAEILLPEDASRDWGADRIFFPPAHVESPPASTPRESKKTSPKPAAKRAAGSALRVAIAPVPPLPIAPRLPAQLER